MPINDQGQGQTSSQSGVKFRPAASQSTNLHESQQPCSSATTMYVDSKNAVLLQTAKGYISAPAIKSNQQSPALFLTQEAKDHNFHSVYEIIFPCLRLEMRY